MVSLGLIGRKEPAGGMRTLRVNPAILVGEKNLGPPLASGPESRYHKGPPGWPSLWTEKRIQRELAIHPAGRSITRLAMQWFASRSALTGCTRSTRRLASAPARGKSFSEILAAAVPAAIPG